MVGLLAAWALLLAVAGGGKLARPRPAATALLSTGLPGTKVLGRARVVRLTGLAEILVAVAVFVVGGPVSAALVAASYLLLTLVGLAMLRAAPGQDCGCFGSKAQPITGWHLAVNIIGIGIGAAATLWPQPPVLDELVTQDATGRILLCALITLLSWLCYLTMTALPALLNQRTASDPSPLSGTQGTSEHQRVATP